MTRAELADGHLRTWRPPWLGLATVLVAVRVDIVAMPPGAKWTRERGGLELASALLNLWAVVAWIAPRGGQALMHGWQIPTALPLMGGREFDLDKSLTSVDLLKSDLYLTSEAPAWKRLLGAAVVTLIVMVLVRLATHQGRCLLAGIRRDAPAWLAVLAGLVLAALARTVDGIGRKLLRLDIALDPATGARVGSAGEVIEPFVPLLFWLAVNRGPCGKLRRARRPAAAATPLGRSGGTSSAGRPIAARARPVLDLA